MLETSTEPPILGSVLHNQTEYRVNGHSLILNLNRSILANIFDYSGFELKFTYFGNSSLFLH